MAPWQVYGKASRRENGNAIVPLVSGLRSACPTQVTAVWFASGQHAAEGNRKEQRWKAAVSVGDAHCVTLEASSDASSFFHCGQGRNVVGLMHQASEDLRDISDVNELTMRSVYYGPQDADFNIPGLNQTF